MNQESENTSLEAELENAVIDSLESQRGSKVEPFTPSELFILPLYDVPFFPGMAAPMMVESGPFFETIKQVAKSDDKCVGLVLTRSDQVDIYKTTFKDLHSVGVLARVLRVIPMEQGGAQVIFNMEKRFALLEPLAETPPLKARVAYFDETPVNTPSSKPILLALSLQLKNC